MREPKKPVVTYDGYSVYTYENPCVDYYCPCCGEELDIDRRTNCCDNCGQAIDWSEVE